MSLKNIAWIGLGAMGYPMASRVVAAGFSVVAFDTHAATLKAWVADQPAGSSARGAADVADAAAGADIVVTIVPTSAAVEQIVLSERGLLSASPRPKLLVDMTSGEPERTRSVAQQLARVGIETIDAPVSGGVPRARTGELTIMLGGDPKLASFAHPLLVILGNTLTPVGALGAGQAMKALNNLASAGGYLIAIEALSVAVRFGIDPERALDVLNNSTGMNNSTRAKFRQFVLSGTYASGFSLDLMVKDLGIAESVARSLAAETPFSDACVQRWRAAAQLLGSGRDHTEIARVAQQLAGVSLDKNRTG